MDKLPSNWLGLEPSRIEHIHLKGPVDLKTVTRVRMRQIIKEHPSLETILTDEVIVKLAEEIKSFKHLDTKISAIKKCTTHGDVKKVINRTRDEADQSLRDELRALHSSLSPTESKCLNEILIWMIGFRTLTDIQDVHLETLRGVLFLKLRERVFLENSVSTLYSRLLEIEGDDVQFKTDDHFRVLSDKKSADSAQDTITTPEIEMCKRIVSNACGPHDYSRFGFDRFFQTMRDSHTKLFIDSTAAQIGVFTVVLEALQSPEEDVLKHLRHVSAFWFCEHLKTLVERLGPSFGDEGRTPRSAEASSKLVDLLYKPGLINGWFSEDRVEFLMYDLVYNSAYVDVLLVFLQASYVPTILSRNQKQDDWIKSILTGEEDKFGLLEHVAKQMSDRWFTSEGLQDVNVLWISWGVFNWMKYQEFDPYQRHPSLDRANEFFRWVEDRTELDMSRPHWKFSKGNAYIAFHHDREAIETIKGVKQQLSDHWPLLLAMSCAYRRLQEYEQSLEYTRKLMTVHERLIKDSKSYREICVDKVLFPGVEDCIRLEKLATAVELCQILLGVTRKEFEGESRFDRTKATVVERLIQCWAQLGEHQNIVDNLQASWLRLAVASNTTQYAIITAARQTGSVKNVRRIYQEAQKDASSDSDKEFLRHFEALLLFYGSKSSEDHARCFEIWEDVLQGRCPSEYQDLLAERTIVELSKALIIKAVAVKSKTDIPERTGNSKYLDRLHSLRSKSLELYGHCFRDILPEYLIRLHILRADQKSVVRETKEHFCAIFDKWPASLCDEWTPYGFLALARLLTMLGDDLNALAAFKAIKPSTSSLSSFLFSCDECDFSTSLSFEKGIWACKSCPDTHFCEKCYALLRKDQVSPILSQKDHPMLYISSELEESWEGLSEDQFVVDGEISYKSELLDRIREKYHVQQEQVAVWRLEKAKRTRAAQFLALAILWKWRKLLRRKRDSNAPS